RVHLLELVRKELVRPTRRSRSGAEAYRFRHILIRDAAYNAMTKELRFQLHERLADWLETRHGDFEFLDEFVGFHLEQAHRCRVQLRIVGAETEAVAQRASERLEAAGRAAAARSDLKAASGLLERAANLAAKADRRRVRLLVDLAAIQMQVGLLAPA